MAEILKARDLSRPETPIVAVKRILPHLTEDKQYVTMFLDESRVLAQLEHENIIHTLEVGQVGDMPFIALEYVFGQDARMLFHRARRSEQPIPLRIACYIVTQVCAALHHAHESLDKYGNPLGLVHRDVSLQNVLISYDGMVKLTDFGIAMSAGNRARTEAGIVKGKFGYMSPEQIKGEPMDRRSDVFATGICLYELLTCERLFSGETDYAAVEKVRSVSIVPPSRMNREIPSALEAIVMKALAKHPRDRYQNTADLRRALLEFMAESRGECSAKDLAECMRQQFADELIKQPTPATLERDVKRDAKSRNDEPTGLAAFDHLEPVSALSSASAMHVGPAAAAPTEQRRAAPSVPPVVPRRDSVPVGFGASEVFPRADPGFGSRATQLATAPPATAFGLDWDEDEMSTATEGFDGVAALADAPPAEDTHDDDVTRQLYVSETFSGVAVSASGVRTTARASVPPAAFSELPQALAPVRPVSMPYEDRAPVYSTPETSYGVVVGIVAAIVAVIFAALYATRGGSAAEIEFSSAPRDALVSVDGKALSATSSPFFIRDLAPGMPHAIEVSKPGYRTWSTRLSLASGQVLRLPLVTLPPEPPLTDSTPEVTKPAQAVQPAEPEHPAQPAQPAERLEAGEHAEPAQRADSNARGAVADEVASAQPKKSTPASRARDARAHRQQVAQASAAARRRTATAAPAARPARAQTESVAEPAAAATAAAGATGVLRVNSRPWSEVSIDGRPVGNTPLMNLTLSSGAHSVHLRNPQFGFEKTIKVQIGAGAVVTKVVDLQ